MQCTHKALDWVGDHYRGCGDCSCHEHTSCCGWLPFVCVCPLQAVLDAGISSIAVVLKHAAIYPEHEKLVGQLARDMGFKQVRG